MLKTASTSDETELVLSSTSETKRNENIPNHHVMSPKGQIEDFDVTCHSMKKAKLTVLFYHKKDGWPVSSAVAHLAANQFTERNILRHIASSQSCHLTK